MSKSRHSLLVEKSIQAALSAIELYNKPNFSYREESFAILMVNAWELLLKAKVLKENNGNLTKLYVPISNKTKAGKPRKRMKWKVNGAGNFITLGVTSLIESEIQDSNLKVQLSTLVELRDNSIHFVNANKLMQKQIVEVATATLKSYRIMIERWFEKSLSEHDLFLIPIAFNVPETFSIEELNSENQAHKNLIEFISSQQAKESELGEHDISLVIDIKLERKKDGMKVRFDKSGAAIYQDSEEVFKQKYPWDTKKLIDNLKERYSDFSQNKRFHEIKSELWKDSNLSAERYLDYEQMSGQKKRYYSSNIVKEFDKHFTRV